MIKHELRSCPKCGSMQTVKVRKPNHILHIIMSILTMGLWLFIYMVAAIEVLGQPGNKCVKCDSKLR